MSSNDTFGFLSMTSLSSIWIRSESGPTPFGYILFKKVVAYSLSFFYSGTYQGFS
jgi:hypothetical protein